MATMSKRKPIFKAIWQRMAQKKHVDITDIKTDLKRCLSLRRLTFIGVGKTVGVGIYVLIGVTTKEYAGPSVVLSFLIAFLVTLLNGLCFAEYASRNPKTGAQYAYMYETMGEAVAFIVGWTSILGFTAAFSMAARGFSGYLDSLFNHAIQNFTVTHVANWSQGPPFPSYPDFPGIMIVLVVMVIASVGVNLSTLVNSVLAGTSGCLLLFISLFGLYYADITNWFNDNGGFFPYGITGVLKASSVCFYAFQGYEVLGMSAEETLQPDRNIPLAIIITLVVVLILYLGVAVSFTLMIPYAAVNTHAPFPAAFQYHSVTWARYLVAIGPVFALFNLCTLEMFTIQRLVYSMASDGLLFKYFSKVNAKTKVPVGPICVFGPVVIALILTIDLSNIIGFMVMYTFVQYSLFSSYMIVLRYEPVAESSPNLKSMHQLQDKPQEYEKEHSQLGKIDNDYNQLDTDFRHMEPNSKLINEVGDGLLTAVPNKTSTKRHSRNRIQCFISNKLTAYGILRVLSVRRLVVTIYLSCFLLAIQLVKGHGDLVLGNAVAVFFTALLTVVVILAVVMIWCREQRGENKGFLVPFMPFLPITALFFNLLMLVSIAEGGALLASVTLACVGVIVYLVMVVVDVTKTKDKDQAAWSAGAAEKPENVRLLDHTELE